MTEMSLRDPGQVLKKSYDETTESLRVKISAGELSISSESDSITVAPSSGVVGDLSGATHVTPNTSSQIAAAKSDRKYIIFQNLSDTDNIYLNFSSDANIGSGSFKILPNSCLVFENNFLTIESIHVISATTAVPFTCKEG